MKQYFLLTFLFFFTINCYSQSYTIYRYDTINRRTSDGLKIGHWIYFHDNETNKCNREIIDENNPKICSEGKYIITTIPEDSIINIQYIIKHGDTLEYGTVLLIDSSIYKFDSHQNNTFSFKNGFWFIYNPNKGSPIEIWFIKYYEKGNVKKSQHFENGIMDVIRIKHNDYTDTYIGADPYVYKRTIKKPITKILYYPEKRIIFSDINKSLFTPLGTSVTEYISLISNTDESVSIDSVHINNSIVNLINSKGDQVSSLLIKSEDTCNLGLLFKPTGINTFGEDVTATFYGDFNLKGYQTINIRAQTFHLSAKNINNQDFHLKKDSINNLGFVIYLSSFNQSEYQKAYFKNLKGKVLKEFEMETNIPHHFNNHYGQIFINRYKAGKYIIEIEGKEGIQNLRFNLTIE